VVALFDAVTGNGVSEAGVWAEPGDAEISVRFRGGCYRWSRGGV